MPLFKCAQCGTEFNSKKARQECCSLDCRYQLMAKRQTLPWDVRFWRYTQKSEGCWLWTGTTDRDGYGRMMDYISHAKPKPVLAHRLSWELHKGAIPAGLSVLHHCDVRNCVNPDHLFLGTNTDNHADMVAKGRHRKGTQINTCKLTEQQVHEILELTKQGVPQIELATQYGIDRNTVARIQYCRSWKHITQPVVDK